MLPPGPVPIRRDASIDWLRAIGITLVVYGHSHDLPVQLSTLIYAFHMPLFFFLAGWVTKPEKMRVPFRAWLRTTAIALIPAYLVFGLVDFLAWFLVLRHVGEQIDPTPPAVPLLGLVYGSAAFLRPRILWFFPALLSAKLMLWAIARLPVRRQWFAAGALGLGSAYALRSVNFPGEVESAALGLPFVLLGFHQRSSRPGSPLLSAGIVVAAAALSFANGAPVMMSSEIGNPLLFYVTALLWIIGLRGLAAGAPANRIVQRLSESTIVIFPLHTLGYAAISGILVYVLGLPLDTRANPWVGLVSAGVITAVLAMIAPTVKKWLEAVVRSVSLARGQVPAHAPWSGG